MSLPIRGAWIEIFHLIGTTLPILSLPIRGAWIEMSTHWSMAPSEPVAPHPGSVD